MRITVIVIIVITNYCSFLLAAELRLQRSLSHVPNNLVTGRSTYKDKSEDACRKIKGNKNKTEADTF